MDNHSSISFSQLKSLQVIQQVLMKYHLYLYHGILLLHMALHSIFHLEAKDSLAQVLNSWFIRAKLGTQTIIFLDLSFFATQKPTKLLPVPHG